MSFIDLPLEIVLMILDEVNPEDLESFAIICKDICGLARRRLREHFRLKAMYKRVKIWSEDDHNAKCPFDLLCEIWRRPFVAHYITDIDHNLENHFSVLDAEREVTLRLCCRSKAFLKNLSLLPDSDQVLLRDCISLGLPDPAVFLLLTLCPNLTWLHLVIHAGMQLRLLENLLTALRLTYSQDARHKPFQKLVTVLLTNTDDRQGANISHLAGFAAFPSVKILRGTYLKSSELDSAPSPTEESSNVESIYLDHCRIRTIQELEAFFRPMKRLTTLTYRSQHQPLPDAGTQIVTRRAAQRDTQNFVDAIHACVGTTLTSLVFSCGPPRWSDVGATFSKFTQLQHLRADISRINTVPAKHPQTPDIFPASLESLRVTMHQPYVAFTSSLLKAIVDESLPKLKSVVVEFTSGCVEGDPEPEASILAALGKQDVHWELRTKEGKILASSCGVL